MRVISGTARGRVLKTLSGEHTRPTTDQVKESIFNIIQFETEGRRVLDLFGGSGQLSIEAVSRGAKSAVVADNSKEAVSIIKENVKHCGFEDKITIRRADFSEMLTRQNQYDIIFLDPPYNSNLLKSALEKICTFDILSKGGIIVCETDSKTCVSNMPEDKYSLREYKYGRTKITVVRNISE